MKAQPPVIAGVILVLAGCILAVPASPPWVVLVPAMALLVAAQAVPIDENDRLIFRAFAGVPLVVALASVSFWSGVIAQCGILLVVLAREEIVSEIGGTALFLAAACAVLAIGEVIDVSNHMIVPVLVIIAGFLGCTGILWVRQYRIRRTYRSAAP